MISERVTRLIEVRSRGGREALLLETVDKIARSSPFLKRPKQAKFLRFIAETTALGEELTENAIGHALFGSEYHPKTNNEVRVRKGNVASSLEEYYEGEGLPDWCIVLDGYTPRLIEREKYRSLKSSRKKIAVYPTESWGESTSAAFRSLIQEEIMQSLEGHSGFEVRVVEKDSALTADVGMPGRS